MADFMRLKYDSQTLKQSQIANQLGYSTSTLQRYSNDTNMLLPYRISPNNTNIRTKNTSNTTFDNDLHLDFDVERPQKT